MTTMDPQKLNETLSSIAAEAFKPTLVGPLLHKPSEAGLTYESFSFPAEDGIPLEAWYIPAPASLPSDKIIIMNHPLNCTRSGYPSHLEPYNQFCNLPGSGNDFELNFIPDMKILHDAGYHVLTYDLRNFGHSGRAAGGATTGGLLESRDVVGSIKYVRGREDLKNMKIGLFSRCFGAISTFAAVHRLPEYFRKEIRCIVAPNPPTPSVLMKKGLVSMGLSGTDLDSAMEKLDLQVRIYSGFSLKEMAPRTWIRSVGVPTLLWGVKEDMLTESSDLQGIYDAIPEDVEKKLFWIEGVTRWKAYNHFQNYPEEVLAWFEKFM